MSQRIAIVLFNLGGPDGPEAVEPFLFNLFDDPAIIRLPGFLRHFVARVISKKRTPTAKEIYAHLGGASPILPNTIAQARALEAELGESFKCFIAMRYWKPRAQEVVQQLRAYKPDRVILLPLYPQFSSTTTASSVREFCSLWPESVEMINCYPCDDGFIAAQVDLIKPMLKEAGKLGKPRLLLSAHGLPEKVVKAGDPYQWQCEQTGLAIIEALKQPHLDWLNCYQSRVGPLKWIGPSTEEEIHRAGHDKVPVVIAPIAFVSEHSETLVELDIAYKKLADECGVPGYFRVPTVGTHPAFIAGLAALVRQRLAGQGGGRICPEGFKDCPCRRAS